MIMYGYWLTYSLGVGFKGSIQMWEMWKIFKSKDQNWIDEIAAYSSLQFQTIFFSFNEKN